MKLFFVYLRYISKKEIIMALTLTSSGFLPSLDGRLLAETARVCVNKQVDNRKTVKHYKSQIINDALVNKPLREGLFKLNAEVNLGLPDEIKEINNQIIVELLNKYQSKKTLLDKHPYIQSFIDSSSENFKNLVNSYSDDEQSKEIIEVAKAANLTGDLESIVANQHQILDAIPLLIKAAPESVKATKENDVTRQLISKQKPVVKQPSSSQSSELVTTSNELELQRDRYLRGIGSSAMLGFQEVALFATYLERPIVVVKNNTVESVYGEDYFW